jgi:hypothetical protein
LVLFQLPNRLFVGVRLDKAGKRREDAPRPEDLTSPARWLDRRISAALPQGAPLAGQWRADTEAERRVLAEIGRWAGVDPGAAEEAVATVVHRFTTEPLDLDTAARELGLEVPSQLATAIREKAELQGLGLSPLAEGKTVSRAVWESRERLVSPFQQATTALGLGRQRNYR